MIKISTLLNVPSQIADKKKIGVAAPGAQAVKMLISYSKALQVMHCSDFKTCYIVLN
jgi:hypothetical protein